MHRVCLLLCVIVLLAGCRIIPMRATSAADTGSHGQILVWYGTATVDPAKPVSGEPAAAGASQDETKALTSLFRRFMEVYPDVRVVAVAIPADKVAEQFATRAAMGLGPDLIILPCQSQYKLAKAGLIQNLSTYEIDMSAYLPAAVDAARYYGDLYGLPFALHTMALYYNKTLVSEPPATLDLILAQASDSVAPKSVVIYTDFYRAFWGIQAFGGQVFDNQGRVVLGAGGFANWLGWLKIAQKAPGVILTNDHEAGSALFMQGQTAYYVGESDEAQTLQAALGPDALGVAPLPAGPYGPAGPMLRVDALMLNQASSPAQSQLALRLARFLTNAEQQTKLAKDLGRIPANVRVRIDPRVTPLVAGFIAQAKTAVVLPNLPKTEDILITGNEAYAQALEGVVSISEAVYNLADQVNAK